MAETLLRTDHLTKKYGNLIAVNDVSLTIEEGSIVGLVGKNGAGKTTLIRLLTGLVKPTSGTFEILPNETRANTSVAAIVERPSIYLDMTAMDNLRVQSKLLDLPEDDEYLRKTLQLVGLSPDRKQVAKNYSLGMKQRLAIAMTMVGKPKLLLLDEPTNGLDPQGIHDVREMFVNLNRTFGTTIVISSHILSELSKFAKEYYFMDKGRLIKHATEEELSAFGTKRLRITVDDTQKAKEVLEKTFETTIFSANTIEVVGDDVQSTQILLLLAQEGVTASNILNVGDSLEDYFISLVGGAK